MKAPGVERYLASWRAKALACVLAAACLPLAGRALVGPPGGVVHVRWQPSIDTAGRQRLEARFRLADGQQLDAHTWRYDLVDPSQKNIRALVIEPAVADTHNIDRPSYSLDRAVAPTGRRLRLPAGGDLVVDAADGLAIALVLIAIFTVVMGLTGRRLTRAGIERFLTRVARSVSALFAAVWHPARAGARAMTRPFVRGIPTVDARALGAFRIALGCGFIWIALTNNVRSIPVTRQFHYSAFNWSVINQITGSPQAADALEVAILISALLFTAGLMTRLAYAGWVATYFMATLFVLASSGAHDRGLPLVTFIGWLAVPWGEGLSLDHWLRTRLGRKVSAGGASRVRGFAIWWPGFTLGVALLAAAYAKLTQSGLAWITGGAVKYHFISDFPNAHVDWGLWIAGHAWASVVFSLGAILIEAGFILNVFARDVRARLLAGAVGVGLFLGLYLFQGIYWQGWLILFLAFLPWAWLNRGLAERTQIETAAFSRSVFGVAQIAVVALLLCSQVYASARRIELEPLLSNYPMYAFTYASPAQFEQDSAWRFTHFAEARADGRDITDAIRYLRDDDRKLLMEMAEHPIAGETSLTDGQLLDRALLCDRYSRAIGGLPSQITFVMERRGFDWTTGRFLEYQRVATSPVPLATFCHQILAAQHAP